ncbi:unnamed protein product [Euphydryas editha]|uniref:Uncharacterized protein n=1 Tax=Euphydryas editha TaxID=104508 RepID=A0AAU9TF61_EUPED|nr:unnamed protein product [Euphydryas editha]
MAIDFRLNVAKHTLLGPRAMSLDDIVWLHDLTVDTYGRFTMRPEIYSDVRSRCNLMLLAFINQAHPILVLISTQETCILDNLRIL